MVLALSGKKQQTQPLSHALNEIKKAPGEWFLWSSVGFVLFYAPLTFGSTFDESWLAAATWQLTIVAAGSALGCWMASVLESDEVEISGYPTVYAVLLGGAMFVGYVEPDPPMVGLPFLLIVPAVVLFVTRRLLESLGGTRAFVAQFGLVFVAICCTLLVTMLARG